MGWAGSIRVDNVSYSWLGADAPRSDLNFTIPVTNVQITPTRSIYVMTAGPMNITVTFLSPIEVSVSPQRLLLYNYSYWPTMHRVTWQPSDFVKQSMPFSYVSVEASSLDGKAHSVQFYSDISTGKCNEIHSCHSFHLG